MSFWYQQFACFCLLVGPRLAASWTPFIGAHRRATVSHNQIHAQISNFQTALWATKQQQHAKIGIQNQVLGSLLSQYGFDRRLKKIEAQNLPLLAEVYLKGNSELCDIVELRPTNVRVRLLSTGESQVVDLGQITTVWDDELCFSNPQELDLETEIQQEQNHLPVGSTEAALDGLYKSHVGRARSSSGKQSLTKKQIGKLVAPISSEQERLHADGVLRQLIKSGTACSRLVDSETLADFMYDDGSNLATPLQRAVGAQLLAKDSESGGRFKRMHCICVDKQSLGGEGELVQSFTIVNGGWIVADQSVRAGSEARKFAERVQQQKSKDNGTTASNEKGWTLSDERIAQRLECLAMGEVFNNHPEHQSGLEVDVRESLKALGARPTPEGARKVLVQIGRWSQGNHDRLGALPWSPTVLEASRWYREQQLSRTKESAIKDGYSDLTNVPFVCVDAKRTSFRDDAIGVRPRASTGRKVTSASKWEILISIADVSDLYATLQNIDKTSASHLAILREAAASRGVSRYDLPLGPLHLLPPVVLETLAFNTITAAGTKGDLQYPNRCVTVWVYIDEKSGKLLDAGIERTVISPPVALSYQQATALLEGKVDTSNNALLRRTGQVLGVVERSVLAWSQQRRQNSDAAQKREERLAVKEFVATQQLQHKKQRDDGRDGFQRTRGHRLVDASLDLYSYTTTGLLRRAKAPFPQQAGSGQARGGRVATAPLRRYVDGMAQRQALSVVPGYGGSPLTKAECKRVGEEATDAYNTVSNVRSIKKGTGAATGKGPSNQKSAIRSLQMYLSRDNRRVVPAVGTGRGNEVVISGVGALAKCKGIKGTLKPGEKLLVQVNKIDTDRGNVAVSRAR